MLSKGALAVAVSAIVVEAIDNGLARTPQMGWVSSRLFPAVEAKELSKVN